MSDAGEASAVAASPVPRRHGARRIVRIMAFVAAWVLSVPLVLWACAALAYDMPYVGGLFAFLLPAAIAFGAWRVRRPALRVAVPYSAFVVVVLWWLTLSPRQDRNWQSDMAEQAWAEIDGDIVTIHNVRNCDYRSETDFDVRWETRTIDLSELEGIDLAITYWGAPWIAHPIVSFRFADADPIAFSIETRKEVGESYSAVRGFFRQYELIYIVADERDLLRLRTNYRVGEDVYLYHLTATPAHARERFLEYVTAMNALRQHPRWYNAVTTNCTTTIRAQRPADQRAPLDWRLLANGKADELLYRIGSFAHDGLDFETLRQRALINEAAKEDDQRVDFWRAIRVGRPGFADVEPRGED